MTFEERPNRSPADGEPALSRQQRRARALAMGGENVVRRADGTTEPLGGTTGRSREVRWGQPAVSTQVDTGSNARADDGGLDLVKAQAWLLGAKITS